MTGRLEDQKPQTSKTTINGFDVGV